MIFYNSKMYRDMITTIDADKEIIDAIIDNYFANYLLDLTFTAFQNSIADFILINTKSDILVDKYNLLHTNHEYDRFNIKFTVPTYSGTINISLDYIGIFCKSIIIKYNNISIKWHILYDITSNGEFISLDSKLSDHIKLINVKSVKI